MANQLVKLLEEFAREKETLREKERHLGKTERQLIANLGRVLPRIGYQVVPVKSEHRARRSSGTAAERNTGS